ncbi:GtrA family protein, partial [Streptomyces anulatus]
WNTPVQSNVFKIVGIGVATLFRFWSYRTWVFKTLPAKEAVLNPERFLEQRRPAEDQVAPDPVRN